MRSRPLSQRDVLILTGAVSFCSLVYEMSIAACFAMMTGDDILWHSITIALYLAALGVGSFAASKRAVADPWPRFFRVEAALVMAGALIPAVILSIETLYRFYFRFFRDYFSEPSAIPYLLVLVLCHGWTLLIGYLSGFEIPLLIRAADTVPGRSGTGLNRVLAANYGGALAGCLTFGLVLLPAFDIPWPCLVAAAINLGVCVCLYRRRTVPAGRIAAVRIAAAASVLAAAAAGARPMYRFYVLNYYAGSLGVGSRYRNETVLDGKRPPLGEVLRRITALAPAVERTRSRYQHIDLVTDPAPASAREMHYNSRLKAEPDWPAGLTLYLNRRFQFRGATEALYHEFMAHVPVQLFDRVPRDVLILGGGDGLLARELLKYGPELRSITNVELDPAVAAMARADPRLRRLNGDAFADPRVRVVVGDAFFFVRVERGRYDAIYVDLPYPYSFDVARLYSVEFFRNAARLLRPGGTLTLDYPLKRQSDKSVPEDYRGNSIIASTLRAAGFRTLVPYTTRAPELVAVGRAGELGIGAPDYDPEVNRLLRRVETLRFLRRFPGAASREEAGDLVVLDDGQIGETMIVAALADRRARFRFSDRGIKLYALTPARLRALPFTRFPWKFDPSLANYVMRPMLFSPEHIEDFAFQ